VTSDDPESLVRQARDGDIRAVARLITLVDDESEHADEVLRAVEPYGGHAHVVGITGAPGVGKSTTTNALIAQLRAAGRRVAVLAVDPSSARTGGALLGDRIRMAQHALDAGVYIRSMASRGHLGGLSSSAPRAIRVLDGVGFDVVIVETVGVGQSEIEIASHAETTLVLLAPGFGDGIQAAKAGILEIGDIFVVNKADRPDADRLRRDLKSMLRMGAASDETWAPRVLATTATALADNGIPELVDALDAHHAWTLSRRPEPPATAGSSCGR